MAGRNCADIVFCIDASGSMQPCFDAVRSNIEKLIEGLQTDCQTTWDVRFDFLAYHDSPGGFLSGDVHFYHTVHNYVECIEKIYGASPQPAAFFTRDLNEFKTALAATPIEGEEMQLLALDIALDFPWRPSSECHRVVVMLTDEPVETGISVDEQVSKLPELMRKIQDKRVKLFIIAPESEHFYKLSEVDRCEYTDLEGQKDGLRTVDFSKMLATIGKSVSVSQSYDGGSTAATPLFDQKEWSVSSGNSWSQDK